MNGEAGGSAARAGTNQYSGSFEHVVMIERKPKHPIMPYLHLDLTVDSSHELHLQLLQLDPDQIESGPHRGSLQIAI